VAYQFIAIDTGFTEDKWVRAAEVRPGCPSVVHHVLVFVQPPGGPGTDRAGGFITNWLAASVPGSYPMIYPDGMAKFVPAGSRLMVQIHYTTNGAPQLDQTSLGLVFADPKTVRKEVSTEMAVNNKFLIPPFAGHHLVEADTVMKQDTLLLSLMPHTHLRGKTFRYEAFYPDGKQEILVDLPHYDFNWQNSYLLAKPKLLPKGTRIHCAAHFDNSTDNLSNPNPAAFVRWGEQTWEEMMIGYFDMTPADQDLQKNPRPIKKLARKERPPLDPALEKLATHALDSQQAFDAFAAAVRKAQPKVDRVCLTTYSGGKVRFERVSYPGDVTPRVAETGFDFVGKRFFLVRYALLGNVTYNPDLHKLPSIAEDINLLKKTLSSSVHAPFVLDGKPGSLNFWSKEEDAFSHDAQELFAALAEVMARK
jgi:hypothetical protein